MLGQPATARLDGGETVDGYQFLWSQEVTPERLVGNHTGSSARLGSRQHHSALPSRYSAEVLKEALIRVVCAIPQDLVIRSFHGRRQ
jgi:hypothetical protein